MWLALILIALAIIVQALKKKRSGAEIGVILGVIGVYIIAFSRMALPEERSHLIEYSILALCIHEALKERTENGQRVPVPALVAFGATVLFGFIDEGIQLIMPSRTFDWFDILFDAIAAFMAITGSLIITAVGRWVRRKLER
jgi:VanZ family protein